MPERTPLYRYALWTLCCAAAWIAAIPALAQEEPRFVQSSGSDVSLVLTGTLQPRASVGFETGNGDLLRYGFGLRRARLRATATFQSTFGAHYDIDVGSGTLSSVDLYAFYQASPRVRLRMGYLAGAQPRSYIFTSHTRIDGIERAAIAELWAKKTIGSVGRNFGLDARYQTDDAVFDLFVHNGNDSFSRTNSNFREGISGLNATRGTDQQALAVSAYGSYEPVRGTPLDVGGFVGYNGSRSDNTAAPDITNADGSDIGRRYVSYSGHAYWGANPGSEAVRGKLDVLAINYEKTGPVDARTAWGWSAFGAVRLVPGSEAFARYETFYDELGSDDVYMTLGASFSPSARRGKSYRQERITLAYTNGLPSATGLADQHLIVLQAQIVF